MGPSSMSISTCMMPPLPMGPLSLFITPIITLLTQGFSKEWLLSLKNEATRTHRTFKQSALVSHVRRMRMVHTVCTPHAAAAISYSMSQISSMSPHFLNPCAWSWVFKYSSFQSSIQSLISLNNAGAMLNIIINNFPPHLSLRIS